MMSGKTKAWTVQLLPETVKKLKICLLFSIRYGFLKREQIKDVPYNKTSYAKLGLRSNANTYDTTALAPLLILAV